MPEKSKHTTGTVTVEDARPRYAWVFDIAIAGAIGLAAAAALINQHRIVKRLEELVEQSREARADSMLRLEREVSEERVRAGEGDEDGE